MRSAKDWTCLYTSTYLIVEQTLPAQQRRRPNFPGCPMGHFFPDRQTRGRHGKAPSMAPLLHSVRPLIHFVFPSCLFVCRVPGHQEEHEQTRSAASHRHVSWNQEAVTQKSPALPFRQSQCRKRAVSSRGIKSERLEKAYAVGNDDSVNSFIRCIPPAPLG